MTTATQEKTVTTNDPTYGDITIKKEDRYNLRFRWPCSQEFVVSIAKLRLGLRALKDLPKAPRGVRYQVQLALYKNTYNEDVEVILRPAPNGKVNIYSTYEGSGTTLPIKDLEKALEL